MIRTQNKHSKNLHTTRTRFLPSPNRSFSQKLILVIIFLIIIIVGASLLASFLLDPEHRTKSTITHLASSYYEDYLYPDFANLTSDEAAVQKYVTYGFANVTLRQLLLHDEAQNTDAAAFLQNYCDENHTYVKFYPDPPYQKTDYHVTYTYSCDF